MREIMFRGKALDTGRWNEGFYMALSDATYCLKEDYDAHPDNTKHYIVFDKMTDWGLPNRRIMVVVDPSTVGQYTGLTDKNGKRIFEGDIVRWTWENCALVSPGGYRRYSCGSVFDVRCLESGFMLCKAGDRASAPNSNGKVANYEFWNLHGGLEVIGNIHDNPELLKEGADNG